MKYAAGSCVLSALNERSSSDCITPSNGERFAGVSGGMALATGLFTPAALNTRSKAPAERQTRVRAIGFKDSSLRFRRGRELFSVRQPGRPHKRPATFRVQPLDGKTRASVAFRRPQSLSSLYRSPTPCVASIIRNETRLRPYRRVVVGLAQTSRPPRICAPAAPGEDSVGG